MQSNAKTFLDQFSQAWEGGYFEGEPRDPMASSTYGVYGYNSSLYTVNLACIRPYVNKDTTVLEIGPGRGAWSKTILDRGCKKLYAVDAAPAEHTHFWEHVGKDSRVTYLVATDFELADVPDDSIDFFFSFGVFCHLSPEMCESYVKSLHRKMKRGAVGMLMYGDFDKYEECVNHADKTSIMRTLQQPRKIWTPVKVSYALCWKYFRSKMDIEHVSKNRGENLTDSAGRTTWFHWGMDRAISSLESNGFSVVEKDVNAISRDPITHFIRP